MIMIEIELKAIMQSSANPLQFEVLLSEVKGVRDFIVPVNQAKGRTLIMALDTKKPNVGLHQLYIHTLQKLNMQIHKINIINYESGEFETQLVLKKEDMSLLPIDCNIYDAIVFSILTFCPVYIEENIFDILVEEYRHHLKNKHVEFPNTLPKDPASYKQIQTTYLEKMLSLAIQKEEYEKAISIRDELQKRKAKN